jgi:hypothetical protein
MYIMYANTSSNTFIHNHISLYMVNRQEPSGNKLALTFQILHSHDSQMVWLSFLCLPMWEVSPTQVGNSCL